MKWLTTQQAADQLNVDASHIRRLCINGDVVAQKFGKAWMVDAASLAEYAARPTRQQGRGRPKEK